MNFNFYDPIITRRRGDNSEPLIEKIDIKKIINGRIILDELPDKNQKCTCTCSINGNVYTWYEIFSGTPTLDTVNRIGTFLTDYVRGLVDFPLGVNGQTATINYFGSGCHYFPASRVYVDYKDNGNGNYDIETTLQDLVDAVESSQLKGIWDSTVTYIKNDIVVYGALNYISLQSSNLNKQPDINTTYWQVYNIVKKDSNSYIQVDGIEIGNHMRIKYNSSLSALEIESW